MAINSLLSFRKKLFDKIKKEKLPNCSLSLSDASIFLENLFAASFRKDYKKITIAEKKLLELLDSSFKNKEDLCSEVKKKNYKKEKNELIAHFYKEFANIFTILLTDANAILLGDPAAKNLSEIISAYPGFFAIFSHRVANFFYTQEHFLLARLISEYSHQKTAIDIHPGATIGKGFCIDHGTGIVIGETSTIGDNVKMYQGVTLGGLSVEKKFANTKRHPTIEDNVVIYANATILGGDTIVGSNSIIGANVWLVKTVASFSKVYNQTVTEVKKDI